MEIHIENSLQSESLVSVCSIVNRVVSIRTRSVRASLGQSRLEDLVLGVIFGVEASLSASMVAETEVFDERQLARGATFADNAGLKRYLKGECAGN